MDGQGKTHLFHPSRQRRPRLARAGGVYVRDVTGKRYLDGSSGAMACNIDHSDPAVLDAMHQQMEVATFGYRLHFETEPGEARPAPADHARGGPRMPPAGIFAARRSRDAHPCLLLARNIPGVWGLAPNGEARAHVDDHHQPRDHRLDPHAEPVTASVLAGRGRRCLPTEAMGAACWHSPGTVPGRDPGAIWFCGCKP